MRLVVVAAVVALLVVSTLTSSADGRRRRKNTNSRFDRRGCHRTMDAELTGAGRRYVWTLSGLDSNQLQVTFTETAFAPTGSTTVFKYPLRRGQRSLGLFPAKVFYDFSNSDAPVAVIRHGRRGRGVCLVVDTPDVNTYEEMVDLLQSRNGTNGPVPRQQDTVRLVATRVADGSQFSAVVRDLCSRDPCGRPLPATYFVTDPESEVASASSTPSPLVSAVGDAEALFDDDDDDTDSNDDDVSVDEDSTSPPSTGVFEPTFLMMNTRVTILGLPSRQQQRLERRQHRRQQRRQGRRHGSHGDDDDDNDSAADSESDSQTHRRRPSRRDRRRGRRQPRPRH